MAEVVDASAVEADAGPAEPTPAAASAAPSRAASILDAIRASAADARENVWWDMPLPDTVPGNLALRLGVPSEAWESTLLVDVSAANLDHDLADLAVNVLGVVDLDDDDDVIEGLDAMTLAAAFAEQLYGAPRPVTSDVDALRELFSMGSPPRINAQALTSVAALYRRWSSNPTSLRSSDPTTSE